MRICFRPGKTLSGFTGHKTSTVASVSKSLKHTFIIYCIFSEFCVIRCYELQVYRYTLYSVLTQKYTKNPWKRPGMARSPDVLQQSPTLSSAALAASGSASGSSAGSFRVTAQDASCEISWKGFSHQWNQWMMFNHYQLAPLTLTNPYQPWSESACSWVSNSCIWSLHIHAGLHRNDSPQLICPVVAGQHPRLLR